MTQTKHLCNFPSTQLQVQVLVGNFYRPYKNRAAWMQAFPRPKAFSFYAFGSQGGFFLIYFVGFVACFYCYRLKPNLCALNFLAEPSVLDRTEIVMLARELLDELFSSCSL